MVVPTAAGGGAGIGRILAALRRVLSKPVIIENVGNAVYSNNHRKGVPDGYHFNLGGTALLHSIPLSTRRQSTIRTDFAPVRW